METGQTTVEQQAAWRRLYRYVYARLGNRQEAEDLTQETFARTLARSNGSGESLSLPYLFTVALNLLRDRWRSPQRRFLQVPLEEGAATADPAAENQARQAWVEEMLTRLPAEYRTVLELRIVQGYSRAEVARRMGRTEDAVRGLQYRALQALRQLTEEERP